MDRKHGQPAKPPPMDPVALTLAVWLGLVAGVTGLDRAMRQATRDAAFAQYTQSRNPLPLVPEDVRTAMLRPAAYGF